MKRRIYIFLTMILGFLLSVLAHAGIEAVYLRNLENAGKTPEWTTIFGVGSCALPVWLQIMLPIAGVAFGFWLGVTWWRIVYIEHRHCKTK